MRKPKTVRNRVLQVLMLMALLFVPIDASAQQKMQWCLKTDQGQWIEMARVKMLDAVDGQAAFKVVVREGEGAVDVTSVTFELHESDYVAPAEEDEPTAGNGTGPWCLITDQGDSIAMSRIHMLANIDGSNQFEVVTTDGGNKTGVNNVRYARGLSKKSGGFVVIKPTEPGGQDPNRNNPWCLITDQNDSIAMSRVQWLAHVDADGKFEIVTKDGKGVAGVKNVRFARGLSSGSGGFKPYQEETDPVVPLSGPLYLVTDKGEGQPMSNVAMLANIDQTGKFEVVLQAGNSITGVEYVTFRIGAPDTGINQQTVDDMLRLLTPVHYELKLSGCGDAQTAVVYDLKGAKVASAPVVNGTTTISVVHLPTATYIVKVNSKALKFIKK